MEPTGKKIMKSEKKGFKIKFLSKMLGTVPKNKEVYGSYVATKAPKGVDTEEEIATVEEIEEKGWTGFHKDDKGLFIYSYMIKGFLKSACEVAMANGAVNKIPAYKKWFDNLVFINPRKIYFGIDAPDGVLERPLRTMTTKGPRVTVTRSDYIAEDREVEFELEVLKNDKKVTLELVESLFEFGRYVGLGQWRGSGGYGRIEIV